jgi:predicted nucleotidyltransferase
MVGALDVSGAVTNPLLTSTYVIALPGGTLSSQDAATTRTGLDVYSKSEVDAAIAAAIAAIVVDNALVGTPEEHSHSLS